jgi:hypothetical protein
MKILFDPFGGKAIEGAFDVVLLVANHAADAGDQVIQAFGSRPEIADTNLRVVEIRMEQRSEHTALRRATGVTQRKVHFEDVYIALQNFAAGRNLESANVIRKAVDFRRYSRGTGDLDERPIRQACSERLVVEQ